MDALENKLRQLIAPEDRMLLANVEKTVALMFDLYHKNRDNFNQIANIFFFQIQISPDETVKNLPTSLEADAYAKKYLNQKTLTVSHIPKHSGEKTHVNSR